MPETPAQFSFDYGTLDTDTAQFVQQATNEIKGLFKQTVKSVIGIGQWLLQVKERLVHGQWLSWLEAEFDWSDRTALNYMNVARQFKPESIADLNIAVNALYLLASPSTPPEAREEALARAQTGERITASAAQELRDRHIASRIVPEPDLDLEPRAKLSKDQIETEKQKHPAPRELVTVYEARATLPSLPGTKSKAALASIRRKRAKEEKPLSVTPRKVQLGEWWRLGRDHYLYCGDPASAEFQRLLPELVSLSIAFPPNVHWQLDFLSRTVKSSFALHTAYEEDQDLRLLREAMERLMEVYTEGGDDVSLSFLPDPAMLLLIEKMDCRFFCADPEPKRCDAALTIWSTTGRTAEKFKSRQTGKKRALLTVTTAFFI